LSKPNTYLRRQVLLVRRLVEQELLEKHGEIGVAAASRIATLCAAVRQATRVERILAKAGEPGTGTLTHEQWLAYSDRAVRYREAADKALAALGIDAKPMSAADRFFADMAKTPPLEIEDQEPDAEHQDEHQEQATGDVEGDGRPTSHLGDADAATGTPGALLGKELGGENDFEMPSVGE
jgi:hypothetical protein